MDLTKDMFLFIVEKKIISYTIPLKDIQTECTEKLRINPNDTYYLMIKGQILYKYLADYTSAFQIFRKIILLNDKLVDCYLDVIETMLLNSDDTLDQIHVLFKLCDQIDPDYWRVSYTKCFRILHRKYFPNRNSKMIELYHMYPDNIYIISFLICCLPTNKINLQQIEDLIQQLIDQNLFDFQILSRIFSSIQGNQALVQKYLKYMVKSLELNQNCISSYFNYVLTIISSQNDFAKKLSKNAVKLQPNLQLSYILKYFCTDYDLIDKKIKILNKASQLKKNEDHIIIYQQLCNIYLNQDVSLNKSLYYAIKALKILPISYKQLVIYQKVIRRNYDVFYFLQDKESEQMYFQQYLNTQTFINSKECSNYLCHLTNENI